MYGNEDQLNRKVNVLQQTSEKGEPDDPSRPYVPRLLGLVTSGGQVVGILEEFVDGANLYDFNIDDAPSTQRRQWKCQIAQALTRLHQSGIIWGDVKPGNVLIDKGRLCSATK